MPEATESAGETDTRTNEVLPRVTITVDRALQGRLVRRRFAASILKTRMLANLVVGLGALFGMFGLALQTSPVAQMVGYTGILAILVLEVGFVIAPYIGAVSMVVRSYPLGRSAITAFGNFTFVVDRAGKIANLSYSDYVRAQRRGMFVIFTLQNRGVIYFPGELFPEDHLVFVRERIEATRTANAANAVRRGAPSSYPYRLTIDSGIQKRSARAGMLEDLLAFSVPQPAIILDAAVLIWAVIELLFPANWAWEWIAAALAGVVGILIRTVIDYRRRLPGARQRLRTGDVWESQFTATDFWVRTPYTRRLDLSTIESVAKIGGFIFVTVRKGRFSRPYPRELFDLERFEQVRR